MVEMCFKVQITVWHNVLPIVYSCVQIPQKSTEKTQICDYCCINFSRVRYSYRIIIHTTSQTGQIGPLNYHVIKALTSVAPPFLLHGNRIGGWSAAQHPTAVPLGSWPPAPPCPAAPCPPAQLQHERMQRASDLRGIKKQWQWNNNV